MIELYAKLTRFTNKLHLLTHQEHQALPLKSYNMENEKKLPKLTIDIQLELVIKNM